MNCNFLMQSYIFNLNQQVFVFFFITFAQVFQTLLEYFFILG